MTLQKFALNQFRINSTQINSAYGGYTYEVTREDGKVVSNVTIDYDKMNLEQYATDQPSLAQYIEDGKFLVDGIIEIYETAGATCEKN